MQIEDYWMYYHDIYLSLSISDNATSCHYPSAPAGIVRQPKGASGLG